MKVAQPGSRRRRRRRRRIFRHTGPSAVYARAATHIRPAGPAEKPWENSSRKRTRSFLITFVPTATYIFMCNATRVTTTTIAVFFFFFIVVAWTRYDLLRYEPGPRALSDEFDTRPHHPVPVYSPPHPDEKTVHVLLLIRRRNRFIPRPRVESILPVYVRANNSHESHESRRVPNTCLHIRRFLDISLSRNRVRRTHGDRGFR